MANTWNCDDINNNLITFKEPESFYPRWYLGQIF